MVLLNSILAAPLLTLVALLPIPIIAEVADRYSVHLYGFDRPDCAGKHLKVHWGKAVYQGHCTTWSPTTSYTAVKFNWNRHIWFERHPELYGNCTLSLYSEMACQGENVYDYKHINDPEVLWDHKCSGAVNGTALSAKIECNPRKQGQSGLETYLPKLSELPKPTGR